MIAASLFSGIGAPEQAMPSWRWAWHAEVAPFPSAVLAHRHPQSVNLGDVSAHDFVDRAAAVARPDVLVFGSPCQSFSVAGRRLGLDDPRGNLALVALGIVARLRPRWFVFENVPGLLSSAGGRDFGLLLRAVDDIGYSGAWAVLDAQHFRVAQRRRRVFLVGHAGDWRGPAAVLLEPPGLRGHSPPRHRPGQAVASGLGSGSPKSGQRIGRREAAGNQLIVGTIASNGKAAGSATQQDAEAGMLITHFQTRGSNIDLGGDVTGTIGTASDRTSGSASCICFDETQITSRENRCNPQPGDPSHPLAAGERPPTIAFHARQDPDWGEVTHPLDTDGRSIAVAFTSKDHGQDAGDLAPTLRAMPGRHANAGGQVAIAYGGNNTAGPIDLATAQTAHGGSHGRLDFESETFVVASRVRRLLPRECERLQGFPDDYTLVPLPLKRRQTRVRWSSDGARYKAIGNSMAVPCVRWILERVDAVDRIMMERAA